jgi:hypothetical protein
MVQMLIRIFKVEDLFQLIIVFTVFGLTGSLAVLLGKFLLIQFFGDDFLENHLYWIIRVILIFPLYQVLLIIVGTIFGQFTYFWRIEKKILVRIGLIKSSRS